MSRKYDLDKYYLAVEMLKTTNISAAEIASKLGLSEHTVLSLNRGDNMLAHAIWPGSFPIRLIGSQKRMSDIEKVVNLLRTTDWTYARIAAETDFSTSSVARINNGSAKFLEDLDYDFPIRKKDGSNEV